MSIGDLIGLGSDDLTVWQMSLRAFIIYVTAILLVKIGEKRFMGKNTAFDMILGIILGSVLSRAVTGNALFLQTVGASATLEMAIYTDGRVTDPSEVKVARFERSAEISVIPRPKEKRMQVVEVSIREGVQTVRIEITEGQ
jgi:uncharacterized membrane protein YcaP (DUF421 family)